MCASFESPSFNLKGSLECQPSLRPSTQAPGEIDRLSRPRLGLRDEETADISGHLKGRHLGFNDKFQVNAFGDDIEQSV